MVGIITLNDITYSYIVLKIHNLIWKPLGRERGRKFSKFNYTLVTVCYVLKLGWDVSNFAPGSPIRPEVAQLEEIKGKFGSNN